MAHGKRPNAFAAWPRLLDTRWHLEHALRDWRRRIKKPRCGLTSALIHAHMSKLFTGTAL